MGPLGFNEILVILVIVLLLFGAKKFPELMRGLGRGMREFNEGKNQPSESETDLKNKGNESASTTTHQP
jgi:sec-independent protein translocase protein TatA